MKNHFTMLAILACISLNAQDQRINNTRKMLVPFNGANYNGLVADVDAPSAIVENILKEKFAKQGVKPKEMDDFLVFRNVLLPLVDSSKLMDAFFKVEKRGKKEKESSTVSFITAYHGEIPEEKVKTTATTTQISAAIPPGEILTGLNPFVEVKVFEAKLAGRQEEIIKAEEKLKDLQADSISYVSKHADLEQDIAQSRKDQETEKANLDRLKDDAEASKKITKKLNNLADDENKYQKKLQALLVEIDKNKRDQETGRANLERIENELLELMAKRPV